MGEYKTYKKIQHEGNHLEWKNPKEVGTTFIDEDHAKEFNDQFVNTGIKYEEAEEKPKANKK